MSPTIHWTRIVLAISFSIYFGAVAVVMASVKRRTGANPVGHTGGQGAAALLNAVASVLVWVTGPAYMLTARSVVWFGRLTFALTVVSYEWKIRIEENYLREAHGEAYAEYCARTGRYLPRLSVLVTSKLRPGV